MVPSAPVIRVLLALFEFALEFKEVFLNFALLLIARNRCRLSFIYTSVLFIPRVTIVLFYFLNCEYMFFILFCTVTITFYVQSQYLPHRLCKWFYVAQFTLALSACTLISNVFLNL